MPIDISHNETVRDKIGKELSAPRWLLKQEIIIGLFMHKLLATKQAYLLHAPFHK